MTYTVAQTAAADQFWAHADTVLTPIVAHVRTLLTLPDPECALAALVCAISAAAFTDLAAVESVTTGYVAALRQLARGMQ